MAANTYPPNWPEIAERIKRLARWRCEHCGHKHDPAHGYTQHQGACLLLVAEDPCKIPDRS